MSAKTPQKKNLSHRNPVANWQRDEVREIIGRAALLRGETLSYVAMRINQLANNPNSGTSQSPSPGKAGAGKVASATKPVQNKKLPIWDYPVLKELEIFAPLRNADSKEFRKTPQGIELLSMISAASGASARSKSAGLSESEAVEALKCFTSKAQFQSAWPRSNDPDLAGVVATTQVQGATTSVATSSMDIIVSGEPMEPILKKRKQTDVDL